jgi:hypothetical protein
MATVQAILLLQGAGGLQRRARETVLAAANPMNQRASALVVPTVNGWLGLIERDVLRRVVVAEGPHHAAHDG